MKLENKVALVTSASRGIGFACALKLAKEGAFVFLGVRKEQEVRECCAAYKDLKMIPVFFDAKEKASYQSMVERVKEEQGRIDILVNNFGIGRPLDDLDVLEGNEEAFFEILDLNLGSVYRITKLVLPSMVSQNAGSIINISSIGGLVVDYSRTGYGASKAVINYLTRQIALHMAKYQIRCNAVLPGLTATEAALKNMPQAFLDDFIKKIPLQRMGQPEDIANAVLFFASEDSSYITGHLLEVAGGYSLGK